MKTKILITAIALLLGNFTFGQQEKNVPASVKSAFAAKFSNASGVKWGRENAKEWEAEFKLDGTNYSANFDNEGTWLETEHVISLSEIPSAVKTTLDKESVGFNVKLSEVSETKNGKVYEFSVTKGTRKMEIAIDPAGKLLSRKEVKKEDEKDED